MPRTSCARTCFGGVFPASLYAHVIAFTTLAEINCFVVWTAPSLVGRKRALCEDSLMLFDLRRKFLTVCTGHNALRLGSRSGGTFTLEGKSLCLAVNWVLNTNVLSKGMTMGVHSSVGNCTSLVSAHSSPRLAPVARASRKMAFVCSSASDRFWLSVAPHWSNTNAISHFGDFDIFVGFWRSKLFINKRMMSSSPGS